MYLAHDLNLGMGLATVCLAILFRLLTIPLFVRSQKNLQLTRLIYPEMKESQEKIKQFRIKQQVDLIKVENLHIKKLKERHGITYNPLTTLGMLFQGLVFITWSGLVQRFSFNVGDYPEMLNGGFFWFKDLSTTDPYFILPILNAISVTFNVYVIYYILNLV